MSKPDPFKGKRGKRGLKRFKYTYVHLAELFGLSTLTVKRYAHQGKYDPNDLESIARYWLKRELGL